MANKLREKFWGIFMEDKEAKERYERAIRAFEKECEEMIDLLKASLDTKMGLQRYSEAYAYFNSGFFERARKNMEFNLERMYKKSSDAQEEGRGDI